MAHKEFIYGLHGEGSDEVRYVGKTRNPPARLGDHIAQTGVSSNQRLREWASSVGPGLQMKILEEGPKNAYAAEARWIRRLRSEGHRLFNIAPRDFLSPIGKDLMLVPWDLTHHPSLKLVRKRFGMDGCWTYLFLQGYVMHHGENWEIDIGENSRYSVENIADDLGVELETLKELIGYLCSEKVGLCESENSLLSMSAARAFQEKTSRSLETSATSAKLDDLEDYPDNSEDKVNVLKTNNVPGVNPDEESGLIRPQPSKEPDVPVLGRRIVLNTCVKDSLSETPPSRRNGEEENQSQNMLKHNTKNPDLLLGFRFSAFLKSIFGENYEGKDRGPSEKKAYKGLEAMDGNSDKAPLMRQAFLDWLEAFPVAAQKARQGFIKNPLCYILADEGFRSQIGLGADPSFSRRGPKSDEFVQRKAFSRPQYDRPGASRQAPRLEGDAESDPGLGLPSSIEPTPFDLADVHVLERDLSGTVPAPEGSGEEDPVEALVRAALERLEKGENG